MKIILTSLVLVLSMAASAEELAWYQGSVVLNDKSVLRGEIAIHAAHDLILYRDADGVSVYPAHKLTAFYYFDSVEKINHKFVSLPDEKSGSHYGLYETVRYGDLLVVRKILYPGADPADHANSYAYFVWFENELVSFREFNGRIFSQLTLSIPSFAQEVKDQKLDPHIRKDIIPIIALYEKALQSYAVRASAF